MVDWEFVGATLLERERRPVLVLDPRGRIAHANKALLRFIDAEVNPPPVSFADEWVTLAARPAFLEGWRLALAGVRPRLQVSIRPGACQLEPIFEFVLLGDEQRVHSVMLVVVDVASSGLTLPLVPPAGMLYEVALNDESRPHRLLRAFSAEATHAVASGGPCFEVLHGKDALCPGCPLLGLPASGTVTAIRLESSQPFRARLLAARRVALDVATINALPLDERIYRGLVQARVEALSQRARLSERERSVLSLLLLGSTLGEVAAAEGITARTAKYHQQKVLEKLGADSRADLLRLLT